jgi:transposase InsO family protein
MESTIGLYTTELIDRDPQTCSGAAEVERETASWVHWYNSTRLHSSIGHVPQVEDEQNCRVHTTTPTVEVA